MDDTIATREAAVLDLMLPQLTAEGFEVFRSPSRQALPDFLAPIKPDAVALKGDRKLVIEVATNRPERAPRLERLRSALSDHKDWELRVIYAPPPSSAVAVSVVPRHLIEDQLRRTERAFDEVGPAAGILAAWSAFEAAARSARPDDLERPQTTDRLIEVLASDGYVTPDEADVLRPLAKLRNKAAHGQLDVAITKEQLTTLADIARTLLDLADGPDDTIARA